MINKICLLSCHNQYESKRYFTLKFGEALKRKGVDVHILSWDSGPFPEELVDVVKKLQPDLTASFHQLPEQQKDGCYFWDRLKKYHWTMLLDPAFYDIELIRSPYSIISCVDRSDCELLRSYHFEKTFFSPHAVEQELILPWNDKDKPIDVLLLGTCYDPNTLYNYWKNTYPKKIVCVLEEAVSHVLSDDHTTFVRALLFSLVSNGVDPKEVEFDRLAYYVDCYTRGIDRLNLIRSIKSARVHVFGGRCWREEQPVENWSYYLANQVNVTVHPQVNFVEALGLLQKSKICLNSVPFFKNGSHERVFASLACGAVPLTSDNRYLREVFPDEKEVLFYQSNSLDDIDEKLQVLLKNKKKLNKMINKGQEIVKSNHTWDHRVDLFFKTVGDMI